MRRVLLLLLVSLWVVESLFPQQPDWSDAIAQAQSYVQNLQLEEKVALTTGVGWENGPCVGNIPPIPRVNFPGLCLEDSPTGVRYGDFASAFPAGINAAATWDRQLIFERGAAMGAEFYGKGVNIALAPMMNMGRVAAGGRNWEGFGADPWLAGEVAVQMVQGMQSSNVTACAKHYIGNEQEHYRTTESSNIDDKTLHEVYGWPFMYAVAAGVGAIMCSYNLVNNTYACQNPKTLTKQLKGTYNFQGFVMSDWSATMSGVSSVLAGLDMTMPGDITFDSGNSYFGGNLTKAVNNGSVPLSRLNDMATRILTPWFYFGQNSNYPAVSINFVNRSQAGAVPVAGDHYQLIRQIGAESTILLKNTNNLLPLSSDISTFQKLYSFALLGSDAGPPTNGIGPNTCPDHGCQDGTLAQGWGSGTTDFPYLISPLEAFQEVAEVNELTLVYLLNDFDIANAKLAASNADVAIVFVSADSGEGYITVDGNTGDRNNLTLWRNGENLIEAVASVNNNTVVVIHSVGPLLLPWINNPNVAAVVWAGLPGQESGHSLTDVLFGDVNPSGKLVFTLAKQRSDYPADVLYKSPEQYPQVNYDERLYIDYRWFDEKKIQPTFEFGFGMSYTNFSYSNLQIISIQNVTVLWQVQATITNIGPVNGSEVAQLYLAFPPAAGEPPKLLRGFEKLPLGPGQSGVANFYLDSMDLSIWDVNRQNWVIVKGKYGVLVGASSRDIRLTSSFTI